MKIEIANNQKIKRINLKNLSEYLEKILIFLRIPSKNISFSLCDNKEIKKLNKKYFNKHLPTDVIAFPLSDSLSLGYIGEVVVSVQEAAKVSKKLKVNFKEELLLYLVHGILHLIGYSDKTKKKRDLMIKKQNSILNKLFTKKAKKK